MGVLEGLLGGFLSRKTDVETQNRKDDAAQQARELSVFQALAGADDPDVRALALTGILHSAEPRKKKSGLRGWIGEMEQSPYLSQMQALIQSPVTEQKATLPSRQIAGGMAAPAVQPSLLETPNASAPAAQPNTSLVEQKGQGAPPMPTAVATTTSAPPVPYTVSHPRQVFLDPVAAMRRDALAKGEIDEEVAINQWMQLLGGDRTKAIEMRRKEKEAEIARRLGTNRPQSIKGEVPNGQGGWEPAFGVFTNGIYVDPDTGQPLKDFRPQTSVGSTSFGADRNAVARELFGVAPGQLTPTQMAQVDTEVQKRAVTQAGATTAAREAATNKALTERWLTPEQAANLGVPFGTNMAALQGFTPLTEDQRKRKDAVVALAPQVGAIEALIKQVIPPGVNALQASAVVARKRAGRDPQMAQLEGEINRAVGNIARVLAAESGRLTQQDVERASKSLADLQGWTDTQESALARLDDVQKAMDAILGDLQAGGEPALRSPQGPPAPGSLPQPRPGTTPPPAPAQLTVPGLFVGPDGQLHTGSPSGPVYSPTAAPPAQPAAPFTPQSIRPVR